jgi:hypothetical protein
MPKRSFIEKMVLLLDECDKTDPNVAHWMGSSAFAIVSPERLAKDFLHKYFSSTAVSAFVRQLNYYGWRKCPQQLSSGKPQKSTVFRHASFRREHPEEWKLIPRNAKVDNKRMEEQKEVRYAALHREVKRLRAEVKDLNASLATALAMLDENEAPRVGAKRPAAAIHVLRDANGQERKHEVRPLASSVERSTAGPSADASRTAAVMRETVPALPVGMAARGVAVSAVAGASAPVAPSTPSASPWEGAGMLLDAPTTGDLESASVGSFEDMALDVDYSLDPGMDLGELFTPRVDAAGTSAASTSFPKLAPASAPVPNPGPALSQQAAAVNAFVRLSPAQQQQLVASMLHAVLSGAHFATHPATSGQHGNVGARSDLLDVLTPPAGKAQHVAATSSPQTSSVMSNASQLMLTAPRLMRAASDVALPPLASAPSTPTSSMPSQTQPVHTPAAWPVDSTASNAVTSPQNLLLTLLASPAAQQSIVHHVRAMARGGGWGSTVEGMPNVVTAC